MLAARGDARTALHAVDRLGGSSSVEYVHDGHTCVAVAMVGDRPGDTQVLLTTLQGWVKTMPTGSASVDSSTDTVTLRMCDPGESAPAGKTIDVANTTFELPAMRVDFAVGIIKAGIPEATARCVATKVFDAHDATEVVSWIRAIPPGVAQELRRDRVACEAPPTA
jgi:hypothetical protein